MQSWCILGAKLVHSWCKVGAFLVQSWCTLGAKLVHSWCKVGAFLVQSWCILGAKLVHSWALNLQQQVKKCPICPPCVSCFLLLISFRPKICPKRGRKVCFSKIIDCHPSKYCALFGLAFYMRLKPSGHVLPNLLSK